MFRCLRPYRVVSYMLAVGSEGLSCLFLPLLNGFSLLVPFSLIYGYFDGAYVALIPVVTSDTVSSTHLTSALGVVYFLHAIPYLISPPIGGQRKFTRSLSRLQTHRFSFSNTCQESITHKFLQLLFTHTVACSFVCARSIFNQIRVFYEIFLSQVG